MAFRKSIYNKEIGVNTRFIDWLNERHYFIEFLNLFIKEWTRDKTFVIDKDHYKILDAILHQEKRCIVCFNWKIL